MRKMLAVLALCLLIPTTAAAFDDWDKTDYSLAGAYLAFQWIDYRQTSEVVDHPETWHEHNPLMGSHPDQGRINLVMGAAVIANLAVAHVLPARWRKVWLGVLTGTEAGIVWSNHNLGVGFRF